MGVSDALLSIERQEQRFREHLNEACRLARELDERVRSIPAGNLTGVGGHGDQSPASFNASTQLRCGIAMSTADVVAAFIEAVKLLFESSCTWDHPATHSAASSPPQAVYMSSPRQKACSKSCKAINLTAEQPCACGVRMKSPPLSPCRRSAAYRQQASMVSATSPHGAIHSPLLSVTSEMSDGSPKPHLDLPTDEATTAARNSERAVTCRKRKPLPKMALRMPAGSTAETAESNHPPDDGHNWRKYGQKDILGAHYRRSYYRCTHKVDVGCPAVKQVQRCDEDCSFFDVIYKGYHTCRSADECWPLAFPQAAGMFNFPPAPVAASLNMLANMSTQSSARANYASLDNLQPVQQLLHVVSPALPLNGSADLSVNQAVMATSSAAYCNINSYALLNPPLQQYNLNSTQAQPLIHGVSPSSSAAHLYPRLISDPSAAVQADRRGSNHNHLNISTGTATSSNHIGGHYNIPHGCAYPQEQCRGFNNREDYRRLPLIASLSEAPTSSTAHDQRLQEAYASINFGSKPSCRIARKQVEAFLDPPSPHSSSQHQQQDDVANSALAFDTMGSDDLLLGYLEP